MELEGPRGVEVNIEISEQVVDVLSSAPQEVLAIVGANEIVSTKERK